jgi:hypothetical protein
MFILEPFIKHEEEQQAYARLHRYRRRKWCARFTTRPFLWSLVSGMEKASDRPGCDGDDRHAPLRTEAPEEGAETAEQNKLGFFLD